MSSQLQKQIEQFQLSGKNLELLKEAGMVLIPELDTVLNGFYQRAEADPAASSFFTGRDRMTFARNAQKEHWTKLLSGNLGADYSDSTQRIGRTHARIELPLDAYMSSYAIASSHLIDILMQKMSDSLFGDGDNSLRGMVGVITRAFAMDIERVTTATFEVLGEEQKIAFDWLEYAVDKLAGGDLGYSIPSPEESDYPKKFDSVRVTLNDGTAELGQLFQTVTNSMGTLSAIVEQMTDSAQELSTRTSNQAASLEETAAAMEEITQSVASSSSNTQKADQVSQQARSEVQESVLVVADTATAMDEIKASSDQISKITDVIEDIAFQTNLLALNAGVEAARAGDSGRGFAVVASEVRTLAANASNAAKQISDLISQSGRQVESGVQLSADARSRLGGVANSFDSVSSLSTEIASAASEQTRGLAEVNQAVAQMDIITQQNASMVEQTTNSAMQLRAEAQNIEQLLSGLSFGESTEKERPASARRSTPRDTGGAHKRIAVA